MARFIGDCLLSEHVCDFAERHDEDGVRMYCRVCETEFSPYVAPKPPAVEKGDGECPF